MPDSSCRQFATLLLFHNGYGDYVMALPAFRAVCAIAPRPLAFVVGAGPQSFLLHELNPDLLLTVDYSHDWPHKDFDPSPVLARVWSCDNFVSLCPYDSRGERCLVESLAPRRLIGFSEDCTQRLPYKGSGLHEADVLFQAAQCLAPQAAIEDYSQCIRFDAETHSTIARMRSAFDEAALLVVAHVDTRPERTYPRDRFDRLLSAWTGAEGVFALLLNETRDPWPRASASGRCGFLRGATLPQSMAIAATAGVFVGVDSCMLHVADLARRPALGLFSPTDPRRVGFRFGRPPAARELRALPAMSNFDDETVLAAGFSLIEYARSA